MTLPTTSEGGNAVGQGFAVLEPLLYQDMRDCTQCGGPQIFVEVFEFEGGRLGVCLGCGSERVARFTREVA